MANTQFFGEAVKNSSNLTLRDILSESFKKHTKADREYALQTGSISRQVSEAQMLNTWRKPWLWWRVLSGGILLALILYLVYFLPLFLDWPMIHVTEMMVTIIPPLIVPFALMILMWEMNVPQNVSLMDLLGMYLAGAIISFLISAAICKFQPADAGYGFAALAEEPGKFIAVLLILMYINRTQNKKLYGMTGIVVGAAVGAAFGGIESASYAMGASQNNYAVLAEVINTYGGVTKAQYVDLWTQIVFRSHLIRAAYSLCGHVTYAMTYAAAIGLNCKNGKLTWESVFNLDVVLALAMSMAIHYLWNTFDGTLLNIAMCVVGVLVMVFWIKRALKQIAAICLPQKRSAGVDNVVPVVSAGAASLTLVCENTSLQGSSFSSSGEELIIGRQRESCRVCYDAAVKGVSRQHCKLVCQGGTWYVQDLNSSYGTFVSGKKLAPYELCPVHPGDRIYMGSKSVSVRVQ